MLVADHVDECPQQLRRDVPVSVDEAEVAAPAALEPGPYGLALAATRRQDDAGHDVRGDLVEGGVATIGGTVGHGHDLE